ncbi:MAG: phosphoenolpyruvate synthase [Desulfobacterota bacterium]|nr:phosphoenolpyruvate synthase [Thermodesulfobacteriota bacterium]MDW8001878.1 PEP/pyruvate-binding domain-containing protein [Deltaproteobacteria bacterium]
MGKFTKGFHEIRKDMFQICGGKASHLGELTSIGLNVPYGFCVTADAFFHHLRKNNLEKRVFEIAKTINYDDISDLDRKTEEIRSLIENADMPDEIADEIVEGYESLGKDEPYVAVRSSVAIKDSDISSFPGLMDTYHYVKGTQAIMDYVKKCWASVFTSRATAARYRKGIEHERAIIAPIIQRMVNAKCAGVMFTLNPVDGDVSKIVIEGAWGIGEGVVSGNVTPDRFVIDKILLEINERKVSLKTVKYVYDPELKRPSYKEVPEEDKSRCCLEEKEIMELVRLAKLIENHYKTPMDIEWAVDKDFEFPKNVFILQARAESVWSKKKAEPVIGKKSSYELLMERAMKTIKVGQ